MKVLEIDQWTSTGDLKKLNMNDFNLDDVNGGDAEVARKIGIATAKIKDVDESSFPPLGKVWVIEGAEGMVEIYKANYASSDWQIIY